MTKRKLRSAILSQSSGDVRYVAVMRDKLGVRGVALDVLISPNSPCKKFLVDYFSGIELPSVGGVKLGFLQFIKYFIEFRIRKRGLKILSNYEKIYYFDSAFDWQGLYYVRQAELKSLQVVKIDAEPYQMRPTTAHGFKQYIISKYFRWVTGVPFIYQSIPASGKTYQNVLSYFPKKFSRIRVSEFYASEISQRYKKKIFLNNKDVLWVDTPELELRPGYEKSLDYIFETFREHGFRVFVKLHPGCHSKYFKKYEMSSYIVFIDKDIPAEFISFENTIESFVFGFRSMYLYEVSSTFKKAFSIMPSFFSEDEKSYALSLKDKVANSKVDIVDEKTDLGFLLTQGK